MGLCEASNFCILLQSTPSKADTLETSSDRPP